MKKLSVVSILIAALAFTGCSTRSLVQTDYDRSANFVKYQTFRLAEGTRKSSDANPTYFNDLVAQRIQDALVSHMKGRGYQYNEPADLIVSFYLKVDNRIDYRPNPWGWGWWGMQNQIPYEVKEGTLVVNLVDARSERLVWQGFVTQNWERKPEKRERQIRDGISMIFAKYPYRAGSGTPMSM
jgi:hypothetical protein